MARKPITDQTRTEAFDPDLDDPSHRPESKPPKPAAPPPTRAQKEKEFRGIAPMEREKSIPYVIGPIESDKRGEAHRGIEDMPSRIRPRGRSEEGMHEMAPQDIPSRIIPPRKGRTMQEEFKGFLPNSGASMPSKGFAKGGPVRATKTPYLKG